GQTTEAGALDGGDVHEHILAAIARLNETKTLLTVEPLHCSRSHFIFSKAHSRSARRSHGFNPISTMSLEDALTGAFKKARRNSNAATTIDFPGNCNGSTDRKAHKGNALRSEM